MCQILIVWENRWERKYVLAPSVRGIINLFVVKKGFFARMTCTSRTSFEHMEQRDSIFMIESLSNSRVTLGYAMTKYTVTTVFASAAAALYAHQYLKMHQARLFRFSPPRIILPNEIMVY